MCRARAHACGDYPTYFRRSLRQPDIKTSCPPAVSPVWNSVCTLKFLSPLDPLPHAPVLSPRILFNKSSVNFIRIRLQCCRSTSARIVFAAAVDDRTHEIDRNYLRSYCFERLTVRTIASGASTRALCAPWCCKVKGRGCRLSYERATRDHTPTTCRIRVTVIVGACKLNAQTGRRLLAAMEAEREEFDVLALLRL
ncbi:hypothetical protein EVAR_5092_1 [Eumeta japonica]|uniref:Uncharacterized protein n=1 Tax=Eumeta variegata TaxID=151549 RepID=A0A4C1SU63_EUMVA|nr:hypothetical protein EVAR_5092_1 [Eumeta japonica]